MVSFSFFFFFFFFHLFKPRGETGSSKPAANSQPCTKHSRSQRQAGRPAGRQGTSKRVSGCIVGIRYGDGGHTGAAPSYTVGAPPIHMCINIIVGALPGSPEQRLLPDPVSVQRAISWDWARPLSRCLCLDNEQTAPAALYG